MIKAVVFDFDGVLADSEPLHYRAFLRVVEPRGHRFDYQTYLREYVGFDDRDTFRQLFGDDEARLRLLCREKAEAFQQVAAEGFETYPGVEALVRQLAASMPLAIASGAVRTDIEPILAGLGLGPCFAAIVTADDVARSKPDPESYRLAVHRLAERFPDLELQPGDCVAIEDTAAGLVSARRAGLKTLGVTHTFPADQLGVADRVVETLEGVDPAWLQGAWAAG
jgi:beta-phosphoglucomutase